MVKEDHVRALKKYTGYSTVDKNHKATEDQRKRTTTAVAS